MGIPPACYNINDNVKWDLLGYATNIILYFCLVSHLSPKSKKNWKLFLKGFHCMLKCNNGDETSNIVVLTLEETRLGPHLFTTSFQVTPSWMTGIHWTLWGRSRGFTLITNKTCTPTLLSLCITTYSMQVCYRHDFMHFNIQYINILSLLQLKFGVSVFAQPLEQLPSLQE